MEEGYHAANLNLQPYPHEAVKELAAHGARLGILFHIDGIPFGASLNKSLAGQAPAELDEQLLNAWLKPTR